MNKIVEISRKFSFEASHKLDWYQGKCKNLHGHSYKLEIIIRGEINKNGILIDFHELKKIVKEEIIIELDHKYLNDIIENPTAENIAIWIWEKLKNILPLKEILLHETENCYVKYQGN